jgi:protein O-GlcNAc transferase
MANRIKLRSASNRQKKVKYAAGPAKAHSPQNTLQKAVSLHFAGHLDQAEALYNQILLADPDHPDALQFLGMLAHQTGRIEVGVQLMRKAIICKPNSAEAHYNLGIILQAQGEVDDAVDNFRQALTLKPDFVQAYNNLGDALQAQGRSNEAADLFCRALVLKPDFVEVHNNLGIALQAQGKTDEAIASYRRALTLKPDYAEAYSNMGTALQAQGKMDEAVASFRQALTLKSDNAEVHNNLGTVLQAQGKMDEAVASYRWALTLKPDYAEAHSNLGSALQAQGKTDEAVASYRRALTLKPDYAMAHNNLGSALQAQGKTDEAVASHRQALTLQPDYAEAYNNLGNALQAQGKTDEAVASFRRALTLKPDYAEAHNNLGVTLKDEGKYDEAVAGIRHALTTKPIDLSFHSNLLLCLNYSDDFLISQYLEDARDYGRKARGRSDDRFFSWLCSTKADRLRVGLVSGDFRNHPVGLFLESILAAIDQSRLELFAYPTTHKEDDLTSRIRSHFPSWQPITGMSDGAAAHLIHSDGLHVLIDLSGHTGHNRLPVFASKPAPVQISWLGYSASTGLAEMDYLLADPYVVPPGEEAHFTETIWRLPESYLCFSPPQVTTAVGPLPALSAGHIVFGSFNNPAKMNDSVVALWAKVLQAVPGSSLLLKAKQFSDPTSCETTRGRFAGFGIKPERLLLEGYLPSREEHLAAYNRVDIALDPFPYNGTTTSVEGLWMGVPFITRRGDRFISRVGESIARNTGLAAWIAKDDEDYVAKAAAHAADLEELTQLRAGLRQRVLASPVFDAPRFARNFEAALWGMWQGWQEQQGN